MGVRASEAGAAGAAGAADETDESVAAAEQRTFRVYQGVEASCIWQYDPERARDEEGNIREAPADGADGADAAQRGAVLEERHEERGGAGAGWMPPMATFRVGSHDAGAPRRGEAGAPGQGLTAALGIFEEHRMLRLQHQRALQQAGDGSTGPFLPLAPILDAPRSAVLGAAASAGRPPLPSPGLLPQNPDARRALRPGGTSLAALAPPGLPPPPPPPLVLSGHAASLTPY